ncbi:MAG: response regulator, partial [Bradymonadaceae bacterium]
RYKSEFLANMSHELRTPLNSMLILSKMLAENPESTLTTKQVEFAETIWSSGADLLALINEILDLSKIESGTMALQISEVPLPSLRDDLDRMFSQIASRKKLDFSILLDTELPAEIHTDPKRLHQLLKNLLSNAFKFTEKGSVEVHIGTYTGPRDFNSEALREAEEVVVFSVQDTGIGIPLDKHKIIFEAFQQVDSNDNRVYGGTGLGLSISREIARLLGGELRLISAPDEGSTFSFYLPKEPPTSMMYSRSGSRRSAQILGAESMAWSTIGGDEPSSGSSVVDSHDDRADIEPGERVHLMIVDEGGRGKALMNTARHQGYKVIATTETETAILLARQYQPAAVTFDMESELIDGTTLLAKLKEEPETRHIPIFMVHPESGGATPVSNLDDALAALKDEHAPEVLLDARLPAEQLLEFSKALAESEAPETWLMLHVGEEGDLEIGFDLVWEFFDAVIVNASGYDHLLATMARVPSRTTYLAEESSETVNSEELQGVTVLVIDDDTRNIFAVRSLLESYGITVVHAENGRDGISTLLEVQDIDVVLMDVMMPIMDGYETIREIRADNRFGQLPIIAVTAKAMKGDREKCLAVGASDYITKPVDARQLMVLLRRWANRALTV